MFALPRYPRRANFPKISEKLQQIIEQSATYLRGMIAENFNLSDVIFLN